MFNIDELLYYGFNLFLSRLIKPDMSFASVIELTEDEVDILINKYNIKGIILDVDDTLRFNMEDISCDVISWINMISSKIKVVVVSNGFDKKVNEKMNSLGIKYIGFAHKPLKKGYITACNVMGLNREEVAVIGDDLFTDIYGGLRQNMFTIYVKK